jgi:hypothetical protein
MIYIKVSLLFLSIQLNIVIILKPTGNQKPIPILFNKTY